MKKRLFISFIALLLCAGVSYSWILDSMREPPASELYFDYSGSGHHNNLSVIDGNQYTIELYTYDDDNEPVPVDSENPLSFEGMAPGDSLRFKILLSNTSGEYGEVKLFLSEIICEYIGEGTCDDPDAILDSIYISIFAGENYYDEKYINYDKPSMINTALSGLRSPQSDSTVILYTELPIPPTSEDDYVELEGRFWFDRDAEDLEDISLTIGKFILSL